MITKYPWIDMFRKLIAGILFSAIVIPGNAYAASDEDTKRAIESFYGEYGFMNKIWACELLSRAFNEAKAKDSLVTMRYRFAISNYMSESFYREFKYYMDSSSKTADQWVNNPLTEKIFLTFFRDYNSDPFDEKKYTYVYLNCSTSASEFLSLHHYQRRGMTSVYDIAEEYGRKYWRKFLAENPTPEIAPLFSTQSNR